MRKSKKLSLISAASIFSVIMLTAAGYASNDKTIGYSPKSSMASGISPDQRMAQLEKAGIRPQSRMPMIADPAQLPAGLRKMLEKKLKTANLQQLMAVKDYFHSQPKEP